MHETGELEAPESREPRKPGELVDLERFPDSQCSGSLSSGEAECPRVGADVESQARLVGTGVCCTSRDVTRHARQVSGIACSGQEQKCSVACRNSDRHPQVEEAAVMLSCCCKQFTSCYYVSSALAAPLGVSAGIRVCPPCGASKGPRILRLLHHAQPHRANRIMRVKTLPGPGCEPRCAFDAARGACMCLLRGRPVLAEVVHSCRGHWHVGFHKKECRVRFQEELSSNTIPWGPMRTSFSKVSLTRSFLLR